MHKRPIIICLLELAVLFSAEGVSMSITPSTMVLGSANTVLRLEIRCSSDGTSNTGIYNLEISRRRFTDTGYSSLVVLDVLHGMKKDPNIPADILAKSPNITGVLVGSPPTSGTLSVSMDGGSITCTDQAEYKCEMTYKITGITGSLTVLESNNFTVINALYEDKGIQLQLTNDSKLNVGTRITYRCSANIGSDSTLSIAWERSSMLGASTDFTTYIPIVTTDIVQDPVVQGSCSYTRTSTMYYNMTSIDDDGVLFRCKVRVYVGNQWYEPTSIPRRTFSIGGVSMSVTPSSMVVGSANSVTRLELRCSSDGTNNNGIYSLEISRRRFTETGFSSLVMLDVIDGIKQDPNIPADILAKSPNITGGLVGTPPTSGTVTLTMDGGSITCIDQAEFMCAMTYKITEVIGSQTVHESTNFTVITVPSDFRITDALYEDKGIQLQLTNDSKLNVGTRITYRCSANIGSDSSLQIVWERSSMLGASTDFTAYTPTVSTDIVQDPPVQGSCSYTRTSTMYYNMTNMDDDGILFRCKVRVYIGNQWYDPTSIPRRTFAISTSSRGSSVNTGGQEGLSGNSSTVLAAVLGVVVIASVILIVILSLFLHRSRKLTKELQSQLQSRSHTYDGLMGTDVTSEPYAILNLKPADNNLQSNYLNPYDRLNRSAVSSEPYDVLESHHSGANVHEERNRTMCDEVGL